MPLEIPVQFLNDMSFNFRLLAGEHRTLQIQVKDTPAAGTIKMAMFRFLELIADFRSGDRQGDQHALFDKQIEGIINGGFGNCRDILHQLPVNGLCGGMLGISDEVVQDKHPLIGWLDPFALQRHFNLKHICIHSKPILRFISSSNK